MINKFALACLCMFSVGFAAENEPTPVVPEGEVAVEQVEHFDCDCSKGKEGK